MPNWKQVLAEIQAAKPENDASPIDVVRRKYLSQLFTLTGRNVIAHYSGWLQNANISDVKV